MRFLATRSRAQLLGHECFHRIQGGWDYRRRIPQITLDGALGRIWMLLEWRAQERRLAIADALEFRGHRRSLIPGTAERESRLEINEGLAQYTGVRLANAGGADRQAAAIFALHDGPGRMSLVRSFAMRQGLRMACCLMSPAWRGGRG